MGNYDIVLTGTVTSTDGSQVISESTNFSLEVTPKAINYQIPQVPQFVNTIPVQMGTNVAEEFRYPLPMAFNPFNET